MKTSSTDNFNTFVTTMKTNHTEGMKILTIEDLLLRVHNKYNKMTANNKWEIGTTDENQQAVFASFNCGDLSHYKMTVLMTSLKDLILEKIVIVLEETEVEAEEDLVEEVNEENLDVVVMDEVVVVIIMFFLLPLFKDHLTLGVEM